MLLGGELRDCIEWQPLFLGMVGFSWLPMVTVILDGLDLIAGLCELELGKLLMVLNLSFF